jgi:hypothetical protein
VILVSRAAWRASVARRCSRGDAFEDGAVEVGGAVAVAPAEGEARGVVVPVGVHDAAPVGEGDEALGARGEGGGLGFEVGQELAPLGVVGVWVEPAAGEPVEGEGAAFEVCL